MHLKSFSNSKFRKFLWHSLTALGFIIFFDRKAWNLKSFSDMLKHASWLARLKLLFLGCVFKVSIKMIWWNSQIMTPRSALVGAIPGTARTDCRRGAALRYASFLPRASRCNQRPRSQLPVTRAQLCDICVLSSALQKKKKNWKKQTKVELWDCR